MKNIKLNTEYSNWGSKLQGYEAPYINYRNRDYHNVISYGVNNQYPQEMLYLLSSSVHHSILKTKQDYITGSGIISDDQTIEALEELVVGYSFTDFISRTALDLVTFGGFAWQVSFDEVGKLIRLHHTPYSKIRAVAPTSQTSMEIKEYKIHPDWYDFSVHPTTIHAFNGKVKPDSTMLYYCVDYNPIIDYYAIPDYYGCIQSIQLDISLGKFHTNNVANGLIPSCLIGFPDNPDEEEKAERIRELTNQMQGPDNAGKVITAFGIQDSDGNVNPPVIQPLNTTNNADIYDSLSQQTIQNIITGHRLNSPTLAGLAGAGGLGGNASEIATAAEFFYNSVIVKYQNTILQRLERILKFSDLKYDEISLGYSLPVINRSPDVNEVLTPNERREIAGYPPLDSLEDIEPSIYYTTEQTEEDVINNNPVPNGTGI